MTTVLIVTIVFGSIVGIIAIISTTILTSYRIRRGGIGEGGRRHDNEDTRMIQEMHQALNEMEARIETLETILMDHFNKDEK